MAFGAGALAVDTAGTPSGFVISAGLVGTLAHVHQSPRNVAGGVIVPLMGGPTLWLTPDRPAAPLTSYQVAAFQAGGLYFNVHTAANPNGEIRGQIE